MSAPARTSPTPAFALYLGAALLTCAPAGVEAATAAGGEPVLCAYCPCHTGDATPSGGAGADGPALRTVFALPARVATRAQTTAASDRDTGLPLAPPAPIPIPPVTPLA